MRLRVLIPRAGTALLIVLAGSSAAAPGAVAQRPSKPTPHQLWEDYPLRPETTSGEAPVKLPDSSAAPRPTPQAASHEDSSGISPLVLFGLVACALAGIGLLVSARRRPAAGTATPDAPPIPPPAPRRGGEPRGLGPSLAGPVEAAQPGLPSVADAGGAAAIAAEEPGPSTRLRPVPDDRSATVSQGPGAEPPAVEEPPAVAEPPAVEEPPPVAVEPPAVEEPPPVAAEPPAVEEPPPAAAADIPPSPLPAPSPPELPGDAAESPARTRRFARPAWPEATEDLWRCEVVLKDARFRLVAMEPGSTEAWEVARSGEIGPVPEHGRLQPTEALCTVIDELAEALLAAGWSPISGGDGWYADRFVWRKPGEPQLAAARSRVPRQEQERR